MDQSKAAAPLTHTTNPSIVGGAVVGLKYDGGVLLVTDTQLCYGKYKIEKNAQRIFQISENTAMCSGGEYADFTELCKQLKNKNDQDVIADDGHIFLQPKDYCTWLANTHYDRRARGNPYWNNHLVAGIQNDGSTYLGSVDIHGMTNTGDYLVTGLAHHFCNVLLTNATENGLPSEADARKVLENCFLTLFLRDKTMSDRIQFCKITSGGIDIEEPYKLESDWSLDAYKNQVNEKSRDMRYYV